MHFAPLAVVAYGAALLITLMLAAYGTPRRWWRQLNLRAIAITLGGTLLFGQLLSHWLTVASGGVTALARFAPASLAPAQVAPAQVRAVQTDGATAASGLPDCCNELASAQPFTVHRTINLRRAASVRAQRLRTLPAGTAVTRTGNSRGDWWQITACEGGRCDTGWVSSLWLRRSEEHLGRAP